MKMSDIFTSMKGNSPDLALAKSQQNTVITSRQTLYFCYNKQPIIAQLLIVDVAHGRVLVKTPMFVSEVPLSCISAIPGQEYFSIRKFIFQEGISQHAYLDLIGIEPVEKYSDLLQHAQYFFDCKKQIQQISAQYNRVSCDILNTIIEQFQKEQYFSYMLARNRAKLRPFFSDPSLIEQHSYPNCTRWSEASYVQALQFMKKSITIVPPKTQVKVNGMRWTHQFVEAQHQIIDFFYDLDQFVSSPLSCLNKATQRIQKIIILLQEQNFTSQLYVFNLSKLFETQKISMLFLGKLSQPTLAHATTILTTQIIPLFIISLSISTFQKYQIDQKAYLQKVYISVVRAFQSYLTDLFERIFENFCSNDILAKIDMQTYKQINNVQYPLVSLEVEQQGIKISSNEEYINNREKQIKYMKQLLSYVILEYLFDPSLDQNYTLIFKQSLSIHDLYTANFIETQENDKFIKFSYFENEQLKEKPTNFLEAKIDMEGFYQNISMDVTLTQHVKRVLSNANLFTISFVGTHQLPNVHNYLQQLVQLTQVTHELEKWQLLDEGVKAVEKLIAEDKCKEFTKSQDFDEFLVNRLNQFGSIFSSFDFSIIKKHMQMLSDKTILSNTLPESITVDTVSFLTQGIKEYVQQYIVSYSQRLQSFIFKLHFDLVSNIEIQSANLVKQMLECCANPSTLYNIVDISKKFSQSLCMKNLIKLKTSYTQFIEILASLLPIDYQLYEESCSKYKMVQIHIQRISEVIILTKQKVLPFCNCIKQLDSWFYEICFNVTSRIQELLNMTEEDRTTMQTNAQLLKQRYPLSCANFDLKNIIFDDIHPKIVQEFLQYLQKYTTLTLCSKQINVKVCFWQLSNQEQHDNMLFLFDLYRRHKLTIKNKALNIYNIIGEIFYLSTQVYLIQCAVKKCKIGLAKVNSDYSFDTDLVFPELSQAVLCTSILYYSSVQTLVLNRKHKNYLKTNWIDYPVTLMKNLSQECLICIKQAQQFSEESFQVKSMNHELLFSLDLSLWINQISKSKNKLVEITQALTILYSFKQLRNCFLDIFVEQTIGDEWLVYSTETILRKMYDNPKLYDDIRVLESIQYKNHRALSCIETLDRYLNGIKCIKQQDKFLYVNDTKDQICITFVDFPILIFSELCGSDIFVELFNSFASFKQIELFQASSLINIKQADILDESADLFDDSNQYCDDVQNKARVIEKQIIQLQTLCKTIERIPQLLLSLLQLCHNGNLIIFDEQMINGIEYSSFKVNMLDKQDISNILSVWQQWQDIVVTQFTNNQIMVDILRNTPILSTLIEMCKILDDVHRKVYNFNQKILLVQMSSYYNKLKNLVESTFDCEICYQTSILNNLSRASKLLVPFCHNIHYYHALLLPLNYDLFFGEFKKDFKVFFNHNTLSSEIMQNMSSVVFSENFEEIKGLQSGGEILYFEKPIDTPIYNFQAIDNLEFATQLAVIEQCITVYNTINEAFIALEKNGYDYPKQISELKQSKSFQILWIGLQTFIYNILQNTQSDDTNEKKKIQNMMKLLKLFMSDSKQASHEKALNIKLQQIIIFIQSCQNDQYQNFIFQTIDVQQKELILRSFDGSTQFKMGCNWFGCATKYDFIESFTNEDQYDAMIKCIRAFNDHVPLILLGSIEQHYKNASFLDNVRSLSRLAGKKYIIISIAEISFAQNMQRIASFILCDYIVFIIGSEFLPPNLLLELISFSNSLFNRSGKLPGIVMCDYKSKSSSSQIGDNYAQQVLDINDATIGTKNFGHICIFLPELISQDAVNYVQQQDQQDPENCEYSRDFIESTHLKQILLQFEQVQSVSIERLHPLSHFLNQSPEYGKAFYEISSFLQQLNNFQPQLVSQDIPYILSRVKDKQSQMCVAAITLDFLLHQCFEILVVSSVKQLASLLVNIVVAAFGLDITSQNMLVSMAHDYLTHIHIQLGRLGIKEQHSQKQISFEQYFIDLQKFGSLQFLYYVNLFSQIHNLPLQLIYDILYCNEMLKQQHPVLVYCPQASFQKIFVSVLVAIKNWQYYCVVDDYSLSLTLKHIQQMNSLKESIIAITPTSYDSMLIMMDQILGFFLQEYVVRDNLKQNTYISNPEKGPFVILFVDQNLIHNFRRSHYLKLFRHKAFVLPCMDFNGGAKKLVEQQLQLNSKYVKTIYKYQQTYDIQIFLHQFKIEIEHGMIYNKRQKLQEQLAESRLYSLQYGLPGLINYYFSIISKYFNVGNSVEEILVMRSIFYDYLERIKIVTMKSSNNQQLNSICGQLNSKRNQKSEVNQSIFTQRQDDKMTYESMFVTEKQLVYQIVGGFYSEDIHKFDTEAHKIFKKTQKLPEILAETSILSANKQFTIIGQGLQGSIQYTLDYEFLYDTIILQDSHLEAFQRFFEPFIIGIWNACSLFAIVVNKLPISNVKQLLSQFLQASISDNKLEPNEQGLLIPICALIDCEHDQQKQKHLINQMLVNSQQKLKDFQHNLSSGEIHKAFAVLQNAILSLIPSLCNLNTAFYLINKISDNKVNICQYQLDSGIFYDISMLSDQQQVEAAKNLYENLHDLQNKCSVQQLSDTPIYLDSIRVATSYFISNAISSPVSISLYGGRSQGKSVLIDVAKLMSRQKTYQNQIILDSCTTNYAVNTILNSITAQYNLVNLHASLDTKKALKFKKALQFPMYHLHFSDCSDDIVDEHLALLIKDHVIRVNSHDTNIVVQLKNECNAQLGLIQISDTCLLIECDQFSPLKNFCQINVAIPELTDTYLNEYFKQLYPQQSNSYNNSFINGYFLIKNSLPKQIADNFTIIQKMFQNCLFLLNNKQQQIDISVLDQYEKRRSDNSQQATTIQLKQSQDPNMLQSNIHSLFFALRSIGCITSTIQHEVMERLASLTILGYLQDDDTVNNPWADVNLVLTGMLTTFSTWQSFIINQSLKSSSSSDVDQNIIQKAKQSERVLLTANKIDDNLFYHITDQDYLNPFWFGHIMEISKQQQCEFDPLILSRTFEFFIKFNVFQQNLRKKRNCLKYLRPNSQGYIGIDSNGMSKFQLVQPSIIKYIQPIIATDIQLSNKVQKYYMNLLNSTKDAYNQIVQYTTQFSNYELILDDSAQVPRNVIFDIQMLLNLIERQNIQSQSPMLKQLRSFMNGLSTNTQTAANLMLCLITTLLRIAISLAAGVQWDIWISVPTKDNLLSKIIGYNIQSQVSEYVQYSFVENGKLPLEAQKYQTPKHKVLIVIPKSLMDLRSNSGASILSLLSNTVTPQSCLFSLFSQDELNILCQVAAQSFSINQSLSNRFLSSLISENLTILMISDDPCGSQIKYRNNKLINLPNEYVFDFMKYSSVGSVKSPVLDFIQQILTYKDIIPKDEQRQKKHKIEATNIQKPLPPLKIVDPLILKLQKRILLSQYNLVNMNKSNMLQMYKISGCSQYSEFDFPMKVDINWEINHQQFALAVIQLYDFMISKVNGPCISLRKFSETAVKICEQILARCQLFFQTMNNIFMAYNFYDRLIQTPIDESIDIQTFNVEKLKQIVMESQQHLINGKITYIEDQKSAILMEAAQMKSYIYKIIDKMKDQFMLFKYAAEMAHYDSICLTALIYFGQNDLVNEQYASYLLVNGFTNDMDEQFIQMLDLYQQGNENISAFNMLTVAILNQSGCKLRLPRITLSNEFEKPVQYESNVIGQNALEQSKFLFVSHFRDTIGFDWPIYMITKLLKMHWEPGDSVSLQLTVLCTFCQVGCQSFILPHDLTIPGAALIEAIKQNRNQPKYFYSIEKQMIDENEDGSKSCGQDALTDLIKRLVFLDLSISPHDFDQKLIKSLSTESCTIVFTNFGSDLANQTNLTTMIKFLRLRATKTVQKRQIVQIRNLTTIVNNALENFTIVISVNSSVNIAVAMKNNGLLTQDLIDEFAICASYGVNQQYVKLNNQDNILKKNIEIITENLMQGTYGEQASQRSLVQKIRLSIMGENTISNLGSTSILSFVKKRILQLNKTLKEQDLAYEKCNELIDYYTQDKLIDDTLKKISILVDNNEKLLEDLIELFSVFSRLDSAIFLKQAIRFNTINQFLEMGTQIQMYCQNERYQRFQAVIICRRYAQQICKINSIISNLADQHFPLTSIVAFDQITKLKQYIRIDMQQFEDKNSKLNQSEILITNPNKIVKFSDIYKISNLLQEQPAKFLKIISKTYVTFISKRIVLLAPKSIQEPIFNFIHVSYLALQQSIHFSYDYCFEDENWQEINLIHSILCNNYEDIIKQYTSSQIAQALSENSQFSLSKLLIQDVKHVKQLIEIVPDICKLSPIIAKFWIYISYLSQQNSLIKETMTWLLQHHSTLIALSQYQNVLLSAIQYWASTEQHENKLKQRAFELFTQFQSQNLNIEKLSMLPPQFEQLTEKSLFAVLCLQLITNPKSHQNAFRYYSYILNEYIGVQFSILQEELNPTIKNESIGLIRATDTEDNSQFDTTELKQLIITPIKMLLMIVSQDNAEHVIGFERLISTSLLQCYRLLKFQYNEIIQYKQYLKQQEIMQKNLSDVNAQVQQSPFSISLLFFDSSVAIASIIKFVARLLKQQFNDIDLLFTKHPTIANAMKFIQILTINSNDEGILQLQKLRTMYQVKTISYNQTIMYPIICLSQSYKLNCPNLTFSSEDCVARYNTDEIKSFYDELSKLSHELSLNYIYIQQPTSIHDGLKHAFCVSVAEAYEIICNQFQNINDFQPKSQPINLRQFTIFILKQAIQTTDKLFLYGDEQISQFIRTIVQSCSVTYADMQDPEIKNKLGSDQISVDSENDQNDSEPQQSVKAATDDEKFFKKSVICAYENETLQRKAVLSELKKFVVAEEDEENALSIHASTIREQSMSTATKSAIQKNLVRFIDHGGKQSKTSFQLIKTKLQSSRTKAEEMHVFDQMLVWMTGIGIKIPTVEDVQFQEFQQSVRDHVLLPEELKEDILDEKLEVGELNTIVNFLQFFFDAENYSNAHETRVLTRCSLYYHRQVFSSQAYMHAFGRLPPPQTMRQLPSQLQTFLEMLTERADPSMLLKNVSPNEQLYNAFQTTSLQKYVTQNQFFLKTNSAFIISAPVFAPIMGNLFFYLKMKNAQETMTPIQRQRIVVTLQRPMANPKLKSSGEVDLGVQIAKQEQFHICMRGFELINADYDTQLETICDQSYSGQLGFAQTMDLFAFAIISNDSQTAPVPKGYVPVPIMAGGPVKTYVLLENKTTRPDAEWVGAFFGVNGI